MNSYKTEGIVLKRKNIGEADKILTVFTKTDGKIQVRASGVRKITSRRAAHIEPLNLSLLTLYKGRTIPTLTEVQTLNSFSAIKADLTKVGFAYHICELIDGLCPQQQENRQVFTLLYDTLSLLTTQDDIATVIHGFEVELLTLLGFWSESNTQVSPNTHMVIENILERKLKSKNFISRLSS